MTRSAVLPHSLPGDMITTLLRVSSWRRQPSCSQLSISENAIAIYRTCGEQRTPLPNAGDAGQVLPVFMIRSDSSTTCTDPRAGSGSWHTLPSPFLPACCVKTREEHTQGGPAAPWSTCFLTSSLRRGVRRGWGERKGGAVRFSPSHSPRLSSPADPGNTQVQILSHLNLLMVNKKKERKKSSVNSLV